MSAPIDPHRLGGHHPDGFEMSTLVSKTVVSARRIRYWISVGAVDKPRGRSRAARYTKNHVGQVIAVRGRLEHGDSLQAIAHRRKRQSDALPDQSMMGLFVAAGVPERVSTLWKHVQICENIFIIARVGGSVVELRVLNEMKRVASSMLKETVKPKNGNKRK